MLIQKKNGKLSSFNVSTFGISKQNNLLFIIYIIICIIFNLQSFEFIFFKPTSGNAVNKKGFAKKELKFLLLLFFVLQNSSHHHFSIKFNNILKRLLILAFYKLQNNFLIYRSPICIRLLMYDIG